MKKSFIGFTWRYGIDAPWIIFGFFISGLLLIPPAYFLIQYNHFFLKIAALLFLLSAFYCFIIAVAMLLSSLYGKIRQRENLLSLINLQGTEKVLDVGCGKGILLIGAAKKLTTGKAYGIDIWSTYDLLGNAKAETIANVQEEEVAFNTEIIDADARAMPFDDNYFDRVISSLVVHNIPTQEERAQAIKEMVRVTKPGGIIAIQDFMNIDEYAQTLEQLPVTKITISQRFYWIFPPVRIVSAQKI